MKQKNPNYDVTCESDIDELSSVFLETDSRNTKTATTSSNLARNIRAIITKTTTIAHVYHAQPLSFSKIVASADPDL